jgi:hypothetical protein
MVTIIGIIAAIIYVSIKGRDDLVETIKFIRGPNSNWLPLFLVIALGRFVSIYFSSYIITFRYEYDMRLRLSLSQSIFNILIITTSIISQCCCPLSSPDGHLAIISTMPRQYLPSLRSSRPRSRKHSMDDPIHSNRTIKLSNQLTSMKPKYH